VTDAVTGSVVKGKNYHFSFVDNHVIEYSNLNRLFYEHNPKSQFVEIAHLRLFTAFVQQIQRKTVATPHWYDRQKNEI
jgi:hypothetical protein